MLLLHLYVSGKMCNIVMCNCTIVCCLLSQLLIVAMAVVFMYFLICQWLIMVTACGLLLQLPNLPDAGYCWQCSSQDFFYRAGEKDRGVYCYGPLF